MEEANSIFSFNLKSEICLQMRREFYGKYLSTKVNCNNCDYCGGGGESDEASAEISIVFLLYLLFIYDVFVHVL